MAPKSRLQLTQLLAHLANAHSRLCESLGQAVDRRVFFLVVTINVMRRCGRDRSASGAGKMLERFCDADVAAVNDRLLVFQPVCQLGALIKLGMHKTGRVHWFVGVLDVMRILMRHFGRSGDDLN